MRKENAEIQELYDRMVAEDSMQAFDSLYHAMYAPVYSFALKITRNNEISEEVVADVFTQFWLGRKKTTIDNIVTYFYVAVRNRSLRALERERRRPEISLEDIVVDVAGYHYNPELEFVSREEVDKINRAVDALPPRCKMALVLVREHGLKYKEAAEVMGVSVKTVETQIARALCKMADELGISLNDRDKGVRLQMFLLCM